MCVYYVSDRSFSGISYLQQKQEDEGKEKLHGFLYFIIFRAIDAHPQMNPIIQK